MFESELIFNDIVLNFHACNDNNTVLAYAVISHKDLNND